MFRTRSLSALFIFLLAANVILGCGDIIKPKPPSLFAGHWKGATLDITISDIGNIQGSIFNDYDSGTVSGRIENNGSMGCDYFYRHDTYTARGFLSINASGHLVGDVTEYDYFNNAVRQESIDLIKQ